MDPAPTMEHISSSGFEPPSEERRVKALGNLKCECEATKKALANIGRYWEPIKPPKLGDWLDNNNHGCLGYDQFGGKMLTTARNTLYIQPIVYRTESQISDTTMANLKTWLEAFYMPCKVVILPKMYEETLKANK